MVSGTYPSEVLAAAVEVRKPCHQEWRRLAPFCRAFHKILNKRAGTDGPVSIAIQVSIDSQAVSRLQLSTNSRWSRFTLVTQQSWRNLLTREPAPNNVRLASLLQTLRQCRADNEFDDATLD